jgi:cell division protein FtsW
LSFDLVCQAMVNMGVVVGLGPITGQPLPLISMGGTSMVFTGLALGIVLSVSRGEQDQSWEQKSITETKENKNTSTAKVAA